MVRPGEGETRDDVMRLALRMSVDELKSLLGASMQEWTWGKLHRVTFQHPLGSNRFLAHLFNLGSFPVGGDLTTIWATLPTATTWEPTRWSVPHSA